MSKAFFMETTQVSPERTAQQIQDCLRAGGAEAIMTEYKSGELVALSFRINRDSIDIHFRLPCRWEVLRDQLRKRDKYRRKPSKDVDDTAKRVAWRQLFRWVEAQMALIATSMVKVEEVFLPYALNHGVTVFEQIEKRGFLALEYTPDSERDVTESARIGEGER